MKIEPTPESVTADAQLNERLCLDPKSELEPEFGFDTRDARLGDYERAGLQKCDPFEACLSAVTAGLMRMPFTLGATVQEMLAAEKVTGASLKRVEPALNNYLRLARQIDRFAQFSVRADESRNKAAKQQKISKQNPLNSMATQAPWWADRG
jgi:hypothetical protein